MNATSTETLPSDPLVRLSALLAILLTALLVASGCDTAPTSETEEPLASPSRSSEALQATSSSQGGTSKNSDTHPALYDAILKAAHETLGSSDHSYSVGVPEDIEFTDEITVGYADSVSMQYYRFVQDGSEWKKDSLVSAHDLRTSTDAGSLAKTEAAPNQNRMELQSTEGPAAGVTFDRSYKVADLELESGDSGILSECDVRSLTFGHGVNEISCYRNEYDPALSYEFTDPSPVTSSSTANYGYEYDLTFVEWSVENAESIFDDATQNSTSASCPFDPGCGEVDLRIESRVDNPEAPQTPYPQVPEDGASVDDPQNVRLEWERNNGSPPIDFELQVSTTPDFSNLVAETTVRDRNGDGIVSDLVDLEYNETYYWRVRASNEEYGFSPSDWSYEWSFTVGSPPPPPLEADLSGPTYLNEGEFGTWTVSPSGGSGSYSYSWEVRTDPDNAWFNISCGGPSCSWGTAPISRSLNAKIRVTVSSGESSIERRSSFIVNNNNDDVGDPGCESAAPNTDPELEPNKICPPG